MSISISEGNRKLGAIPSFSLPPVTACPGAQAAGCAQRCYARRFRPSARQAYARNLQSCKRSLRAVASELRAYIDRHNVQHFRIHAAGDFYSPAYADMWRSIIAACPATRFLAFTKAVHALAPLRGLGNLSLVWSAWDYDARFIPTEVPRNMPVAYTLFRPVPSDQLTREKTSLCSNHCGECGHKCWDMQPGTRVAFHVH